MTRMGARMKRIRTDHFTAEGAEGAEKKTGFWRERRFSRSLFSSAPSAPSAVNSVFSPASIRAEIRVIRVPF